MTVILRDYQQRMVNEIRGRWNAGSRRVLGVLPTGGGKTEIALAIIEDQKAGGRALIVTERKTLCDQWVQRVRKHGTNQYVGVLQGENTRAVYAPILVATAQTIRRRGVPEGVTLVVIDESHIWHKTHDDVLGALENALVLGLTATPLREGLGLRFDSLVIGARIRELQRAGHLVRARYFAPKPEAIQAALNDVAVRAGDFAAGDLSRKMRTKVILGDVVGEWQRRAEDRQTIAFCVDKQHAHDLAGEFCAVGVSAEVVLDDTADDERKRLFEAFSHRDLRVLASVGVLGVGFDAPIASCAILARPTLSMSLYLQQGGRVLRPHPSKSDALILDHSGNTGRFGLLEEFEPPSSLSQVDSQTDRVSRHRESGVWACVTCEAINEVGVTICEQCGTPLRRHSAVVVVDGELHDVHYGDGETLPGPTIDRVKSVYCMFRHYGRSRGMKNPDGWAWYAAQRRFDIPEHRARSAIPLSWRRLDPLPPDDDTARWLTADFRRSRVLARYRESHSQSAVKV